MAKRHAGMHSSEMGTKRLKRDEDEPDDDDDDDDDVENVECLTTVEEEILSDEQCITEDGYVDELVDGNEIGSAGVGDAESDIENVPYDGELVVELACDNDENQNPDDENGITEENGITDENEITDENRISVENGIVDENGVTDENEIIENTGEYEEEEEADGQTIHVSPDGILDENLTEQVELDEQAMQELSTEHIQTENNQLEFDHEVSLIDDNEQVVMEDDQFDGEDENIHVVHMEISEPLSMLRQILELKLQCSLQKHEFWLQDSVQLDSNKNLVSQCIQGSGVVQINIEVKSLPGQSPRLNIVDVLKPVEDADEEPEANSPSTDSAENITRWIVDQNFRRDQERLKIPFDPLMWNFSHVKHWLKWAIKQFSLVGVNVSHFNMTGQQLCELKHDEFIKHIPNDRGDIFWTHLELLRKCKFVAVMQQPDIPQLIMLSDGNTLSVGRQPKSKNRSVRMTIPTTDRLTPGNRTGNNGQIQLWQFLLELLTDKDYRDLIMWIGDEGEFKLNNPEVVAQLWGQRKNKVNMNYEKLSRALRYYYDGDMIAKVKESIADIPTELTCLSDLENPSQLPFQEVHGKRFVYKFVCDLQTLLGYSAAELSRQMAECAGRPKRHIMHTKLEIV